MVLHVPLVSSALERSCCKSSLVPVPSWCQGYQHVTKHTRLGGLLCFQHTLLLVMVAPRTGNEAASPWQEMFPLPAARSGDSCLRGARLVTLKTAAGSSVTALCFCLLHPLLNRPQFTLKNVFQQTDDMFVSERSSLSFPFSAGVIVWAPPSVV